MSVKILAFLFLTFSVVAQHPDNWVSLPKVPEKIAETAYRCFYKGDIDCIEKLLGEGYDPNFSYDGSGSLLHYVSFPLIMRRHNDDKPWLILTEKQRTILDYLISLGVDPDRFDHNVTGGTPLYYSIIGKLTDFNIYPVNVQGYPEYLISKGVNVNRVYYSRTMGWSTAWNDLDAKSRFELFDLIVVSGANFKKYGCETDETGIYTDRLYLKRLGIDRDLIFNYAWKYYHKVLGAPDVAKDEFKFYDWLDQCNSGGLN